MSLILGNVCACQATSSKDTTCVYGQAVNRANTSSIVYVGQFKRLEDCQARACLVVNASSYTWFEPAFMKGNKWSSGCYVRIDGEYPKIKKDLVYSGQIKLTPNPPAPAPKPHPSPAPKPQPPAPSPGPSVPIQHTVIASPPGVAHDQPNACDASLSPQGAAVQNQMYFWPLPGTSTNITIFDPSTRKFSTLPIDPSSGALSMTKGVAMAGVEGVGAGSDDFLAVSGGGTKNVLAYNLQTGKWSPQRELKHASSHSTAVGCSGLYYTFTGDFKKSLGGHVGVAKPSDRQIYAYNFSSGVVFANNGDKTRGGAASACGAATHGSPEALSKVMFAGGSSDAGLTSQVEAWRFPLARRGEPKLDIGYKNRDLGGGACGGLAVFVGGSDGKSLYNNVVTFDFNYNTSTPAGAGGDKHKYAVKHASAHARVGCLGDRFALISGGASGRDCVQTVSVLDTHHPPGDGAVLPVLATLGGSTGTLAVASLSNGEAVGFFDGVSMQLFTMGK